MPRWAVALVAAFVAAAVVVVGAVVVRAVVGSTALLESTRTLGCQTDDTVSGFQGYCVERVSRPELIVVPGRHEIRVEARIDGSAGGRYLTNRDPFTADATLATRLTDDGITVVDPSGTALSISRDRLDSLAD
ncbi:hypothetical protein [Solicola sp. PLA-1-18]|uniref:hypothetical protein n=1 Tax=Solicola sp. PLA-1-18 TaxID=3380532 RepID=UPI003B76AA7D